MALRPRLVIGACLALFCLFGIIPYSLLEWGVSAGNFRSLAEQKAGDLLKAKVEIGKIRVRFPNRVVLSDLKVSRNSSGDKNSTLQINHMVFRYGLKQLVSRKLEAPASVTLRSPKIAFNDSLFPYSAFAPFDSSPGVQPGSFMKLEFAGGEVRFPVPGIAAELVFSNIKGQISPASNGKIRVDLRAVLNGLAGGRIKIKGEIDPVHKRHQLRIGLDAVRGSWGGPLSGRASWEGDVLTLEELRSKVYGWDSRGRGFVKGFPGEPEFNLNFDLGRSKQRAGISLRGDLRSSMIQASVFAPGLQKFEVKGKILRDPTGFIFEDLETDTGHGGRGKADFYSGDIHFLFEKNNERIGADLNLRKPGVRFNFKMDHVPVMGLDLVTSGAVSLMPVETGGSSRAFRFKGAFKTDYFILEYVPFNDLQGAFDLSPWGIRNFSAGWGEVFGLSGELQFGNPPQAGFVLRSNRFNLKNVKQFAARPLPKELGGFLEGRLKLDGAIRNPEISGKFTVREGKIGKLEYDLGIFQFRGYPPYLPLEDSRIFKGRSTLSLNGAIDFRLRNIFGGIKLQTDDKLVILKGFEMNTSESEGDLEIETPIAGLPVLNVKPGQGTPGAAVPQDGQDSSDRYVTVGPKFKF